MGTLSNYQPYPGWVFLALLKDGAGPERPHTPYKSLTHPFWFLLTSAFFHWKSVNFSISRNTDIDCICQYNFFWVFKDCFSKNQMMWANLAIPGFLRIKVFWNNSHNVIFFVYDVTNKILSRDSNYIIDLVMRPKFDDCSIFYERSYHNLNFIKIRPQKTLFLRGALGSIIWDWH